MSTTDPGPRRAAPAGDVDTRTPEPWEVAESPRRPRNNGELALSTLLVLLGVYLVIGAGGITVPGSSNTVGPRFFPYLVGAATIVVGGLLAFRVLRGDRCRRTARTSTPTRRPPGGPSGSSPSPSSPTPS